MEKLSMCRICLVQNVRMYVVVNKDLQELYETLTDVPFVTEDCRPMLACFFCCAKMKQCEEFQRKCLKAEELFSQMLNEDREPNTLRNHCDKDYYGGYIKTSTENINISGKCCIKFYTIKEDLAVCEKQNNFVELKEEHLSYEMEERHLRNSISDVESIDTLLNFSELEDTPSHYSDSEGIQSQQSVSENIPLYVPESNGTPSQQSKSENVPLYVPESDYTPSQPSKSENIPLYVPESDDTPAQQSESDNVPLYVPESDGTPSQQSKSDNVPLYIPESDGTPSQQSESDNVPLFLSESDNVPLFLSESDDILQRHSESDDMVLHYSDPEDVIQHHFEPRDVIQHHFESEDVIQYHSEPQCNSKKDSEDNTIPLMELKTDMEEGNEVLMKELEVKEPKRVPIVKIVKLDLQRTQTGDIITDKQKKTKRSNRQIIRNTQCDQGRVNKVKKSTLRHLCYGESPCMCDICHRIFRRKGNLVSHLRVHIGKKPEPCKIICDVCQRSFSDRGNFIRHFRIHTGEKPYKCVICERSFTRSGDLNSHIRRHTGDKPYKCELCSLSFSDNNYLAKHMRIHGVEQDYKCDICQRSFSRKGNLARHFRKHTGEDLYKCDICQLCFSRKGNLTRHFRKHSSEYVI